MWCEVLGLEAVGVHDNFFALGGHSLRGLQLIDRVNRRLETDLKIVDLFRMPTIAQLAELLVKPSQQPHHWEFLDVVRPTGQRGTVVWVGAHMTGLLECLDPRIGVIHLKLDGLQTDDFHRLDDDFQRLDVDATADRYLAELLQSRPRGPLVIAGFSYGGLLAYALTLRLRGILEGRVEQSSWNLPFPGALPNVTCEHECVLIVANSTTED